MNNRPKSMHVSTVCISLQSKIKVQDQLFQLLLKFPKLFHDRM